MIIIKYLLVLFLITLYSCGGGGSGSTSEVSQPVLSSVTPSQSFSDSTITAYSIKGIWPDITAYSIKGIWPDGVLSYDEIVGNNASQVGLNISWKKWEPEDKQYFCDNDETEFDKYCFKFDREIDTMILEWTKRGVSVTAILIEVPEWARVDNCNMGDYCAPKNPQDFGRFAGMLAHRYNGNDHGKITNFVVLNEVNSSLWFNIGCRTSCNQTEWINKYTEVYNAAYDRIIEQQSEAKVLISLNYNFGQQFDEPDADIPQLSGITFLNRFAAQVGSRAWRVAYYPYPPELPLPYFSADDYYLYGKVTFGSIGVLAGWLRKTFQDNSSAWEIHLTENGISSYVSEEEQATWLCNSFQNVLGTPGIQSYIYYRERDNPFEMKGKAFFGLLDSNKVYKQAWTTWISVDNADTLSCGFQDLPYVRLRRGFSSSRGHWVSSRLLPEDFDIEKEWCLLRDGETSTMRMLYECRVDNHNLLSTDVNCENLDPLGPVGYVFRSQVSGTIPLYRCQTDNGEDHFISTSSDCEGYMQNAILGYAYPLNSQTQNCQ